MKKISAYIATTAVIGLSVFLYLNTLNNDFVNFDDPDLVIRNNYIKRLNVQNIKDIFTPGVVGAYQPVRTLSYAIDYHFWKLNPAGFHLTNIICHAFSTLFVYLIAYVLTRQVSTAALTSLLFAAHPVHVEAIAWVAGRRDVLSSTFGLVSFFCFIKCLHPQQNDNQKIQSPSSALRLAPSAWYIFSLVFFASALLTKPSLVILPLLLVFYDVCFLHPPLWKKWRRGLGYISFFFVALIFTQVFMKLSRAAGVVESWGDGYTRLLTMMQVFAEYIVMLFVPRNLSATYGITPVYSFWEPLFLVSVAVLGLVFVLTIRAWKTSKVAFFGIGWFFISLLPVSNIIPIAIVKADRYLYLPSAGFCLVIAWIIVRCQTMLSHLKGSASGKRLIAYGYWLLIGLVLMSYAILTVQRNRDWKNSHSLWTATLETNPNSSLALNNLGLIYAQQGMYEKAIALYEQLLDYHPNQEHIERVYGNIANAYIGMQLFDEAIDYYQHALEIDPEYMNAYLGLGRISMKLGQYDQAEGIYMNALDLNDRNESLYTHLGNLYAMQGKYDDAITSFEKALEINPFSMNAYNGLGLSYAWKGETDKALSLYQQTLRQNPDATVIRNSLGTLYMNLGDIEKAITEFTGSLEIYPENVEIRNNLGILYLRTQRYKEAAREFMTSLERRPGNPKTLSNLGIAYVHIGLYDEAIRMYQLALDIDPTLFRTHVLLGDVCFGTAQISCAVEAYQKALELSPDNREIIEKLEAAKKKELEQRREEETEE